MSLRLVSKHGSKKPIGFVRGVPVYGISGAQPPEGDDTGDGDGGDGGDGDGDGKDGGSGEGEGDPDDKKDQGKDGVISKKEYDAAIARMKAADKNNADLQKKIKEYEDKDKSELDKATSDLETATAERDTLKAENADLKFGLAFALNPKHSWQDPEIVLGLVRKHEDVTVEEDGTIKGMDKALDDIAKKKPYLLKNTDTTDSGSGGTGPTGTGTGSGKGGGKGTVDEAALKKKYPALNI